MKRSSLLLAVDLASLIAAAVAATLLPFSAFRWVDLLWLVGGLAILKLSDVWLPRGDAIGMSSALALGALLLFDARVVLAVLLTAEVIALLPRGRAQKLRAAVSSLAAEAVATVTCSAALVSLGLHPGTGVLTRTGTTLLPVQYVFVLLVGLLFAVLEYGLLQTETAFRDRRPVAASILGSLSYSGWLVAAQSSAGVLVALMYRTMGTWGLVVSVFMILVMRQSFVLLLDVRQAYDATIGVLIKAMDAQSPGREGVSGRNADLCVRIGRTLGMHGRELERVRYAALLLGLGSDDSAREPEAPSLDSSRIIEGVEFLSDVAPVLRLCDASQSPAGVHRADLTCSYIVMAVAASTGTVPRVRLDRLRERVSPRIVREVDQILDMAGRAGELADSFDVPARLN